MFHKKKEPKGIWIRKYYIPVYIILIGVFLFSAYKLVDYYYNNYKAEKMADALSEKKKDAGKITDDMLAPSSGLPDNIPSSSPLLPSSEGLQPGNSNNNEMDTTAILPQYKELYLKNQDMAGWITIPNTNINYPVMYHKEDNTTYLHTDFEGNGGSKPGCIFIDGRSHFLENEPSTNLILYGHNMKVGTMFHDIMNYQEESYYLAHPVIQFDTLYETATYEIFAVFPSEVQSEDDTTSFKYYSYYYINSKEQFTKYIEEIQNLSLYDTGITARWGDNLITLSTCADYEPDTNKRFVVVARKQN